VIVRFIKTQVPNCCEILHHQSKATLILMGSKIRRRTHTCARKVEDPPTSLSHFHYGNDTTPANETVDPASEQNHMSPPGYFLTSLDSTSLDSSGSVEPRSSKPGPRI